MEFLGLLIIPRTLKNINEDGIKKAELGAKMIGKNVAVNGAFDCISQKYSTDVVYAVYFVIIVIVTNSTILCLLVFVCLAEAWKFLPVMLP